MCVYIYVCVDNEPTRLSLMLLNGAITLTSMRRKACIYDSYYVKQLMGIDIYFTIRINSVLS